MDVILPGPFKYTSVERLTQAHQSKHCIEGSTSRERERERERECVFFFQFRQFVFYSGNSSTYFKVLCRSLQKNLIVRDV